MPGKELKMSHRYLPLLLLIACWPAYGQVYKCVAANGDLTYSQTPCPDKDSKVTMQKAASSGSSDETDCELVHGFALSTAMGMKRGVSSSEVFDRYGGLSSLSRGSVSLISYVYQYRTNDDVSAERVADLSLAKCQANAFGDVGCEQLPRAYTGKLGGCDVPDGIKDAMFSEMVMRDGGLESRPATSNATTARTRTRVSPDARAHAYAERREAKERAEQRREECRQRIRERIDVINAELRSGYSASRGATLKNQRRDLEQQLREC